MLSPRAFRTREALLRSQREDDSVDWPPAMSAAVLLPALFLSAGLGDLFGQGVRHGLVLLEVHGELPSTAREVA